MPRQLVHEKRYATLTYDSSTRSFNLRWRGFAHTTEFRAAMLDVLAHAQICAPAARSLVFDARDLGPVLQDDIEWAARVVGAQLYACGVVRSALVPAATALGRMTCALFQQATEPMFLSAPEARVFDDIQNAERWVADITRAE